MQTNAKPSVLSVVVAGQLLGLSRTAAYSAAASGELAPGVPVIRIGRRKLAVPTSAVEDALGINTSDYLAG